MGAEPPQRRTDGQAGPGTSALNNLFVFQPNIQRQYPPPRPLPGSLPPPAPPTCVFGLALRS